MEVAIVIPVYNEERKIEDAVRKVLEFTRNITPTCGIIVADNASTDKTLELAKMLSEKHVEVGWVHMDEKGRGRALRAIWTKTDADVLVYMDVDLATDLGALPCLIHAILEEGYDIAVGSRLERTSQVTRSLKREVLSRGYNLLLKFFFGAKFSDGQCGFKAIRKNVVLELLPKVRDNGWFFDTELLVRAQKAGFRIKNVAVIWHEGPDSKVSVLRDTISMGWSILTLRLSLLCRDGR